MKIQWIEDICNAPGLCATERRLLQELANEVYRLRGIQNHQGDVQLQKEIEDLRLMVNDLKINLELKTAEVETLKLNMSDKPKRGRPSKDN
jgi:hypothetical protein